VLLWLQFFADLVILWGVSVALNCFLSISYMCNFHGDQLYHKAKFSVSHSLPASVYSKSSIIPYSFIIFRIFLHIVQKLSAHVSVCSSQIAIIYLTTPTANSLITFLAFTFYVAGNNTSVCQSQSANLIMEVDCPPACKSA